MLKSKSFTSKEVSVTVVVDTEERKAYVHYMYATKPGVDINSTDACDAFDDLEDEIRIFCTEEQADLWTY